MNTFDIVFISSIRWDYSWHRQQQVMDILAAKGHRVLFVEPSNYRLLLKKGKLFEVCTLKPNIYLFKHFGFPLERFLKPIHKINAWISDIGLKRAVRRFGFQRPVLWLDRVHGVNIPGRLKNSILVYDIIDEITAFGRFKNEDMLLSLERMVLNKADIVFSSSRTLMENKKNGKGNMYLIPNGADYEHFMKALDNDTAIAEEISHIRKPVIGFYGTVSERRINFELLTQVAKERPDWSFVLIGPVSELNSKDYSYCKNIHFIDAKPYSQLPRYLKGFDIGMIPYKLDASMNYVYPRKLHEYFAAGKPVVATALPELAEFAEAVYIADDSERFIAAVEKAFVEEEGLRKARIDIAKMNSWEMHVEEMKRLIAASLRFAI